MTKRIIWAILLLQYIYTILFVIPHKGFDFSDHGYYLYNTMLMSTALVPSSGFAALFNHMFYLLGIKSYLFYEYFYMLLLSLAITVYWSSIKPLSQSLLYPIVIITSLSLSTATIVSYQNAPCLYLLLGLGCLFHAVKTQAVIRSQLFAMLAAILLVIASFSNVSLLPSLLLNWVIVYYYCSNKNYQAKLFHRCYFITAIVLAIIYFHSSLSLFSVDAHRNQAISQIFLRVPEFFLDMLRTQGWALFIIMCYLGVVDAVRTYASSTLHRVKPIIFIAGLIILFIVYCYDNPVKTTHYLIINNYYAHCLFLLGGFSFYLLLYTAVNVLVDHRNRSEFVASILMALLFTLGLSVTTTSSFMSHIRLMAPLFLSLSYLIISNEAKSFKLFKPLIQPMLLSLALLLMACSIYYYNQFAYRNASVSSAKVVLKDSPLFGIYVSYTKQQVIHALVQDYADYQCQDKYFLAYPSLPLLYYLFERTAPFNKPWLSSTVGGIHDATALMSELNQAKHWCVIYAADFNQAGDYLPQLAQYLAKHSQIKIARDFPGGVETHRSYPQHYMLYVQ